MKPKFIVLSIIFLLSTIPTRSQVDPIWQAYYDSTYATWDIDWKKTIQLLDDAKLHLESNVPNYNSDSTYSLTLNDLGIAYQKLGDFSKALLLLKQSLEITESNLGRAHIECGIVLNNIGNLYQEMGQYEDALPVLTESLEIAMNTVGKGHSDYGTSLHSLGDLYRVMGRYEEALPMLIESVENAAINSGRNDPDYGTSVSNLGALYHTMGNYDAALPLYLEAMRITENSLGKENWMYSINVNNLASLYFQMGHYPKALSLNEEALKIKEKSLGKEHWTYGLSLNNLASVYIEMGEYDKALPLLQEALENTAKSLGSKHLFYSERSNDLGKLYELISNYEAVIPLYIEANSILHYQIQQVFEVSSEKNKQDFLNHLIESFHRYHSFAFRSEYNYHEFNKMLFNNELLQKGLILNSTHQTIEAIRNSGDKRLVDIFNQWQNLRNQIANEYKLPLANRIENIDSLEYLANLLEQNLVQQSLQFADARRQITWEDIHMHLKPNEAAIEFVHFNFMDKKATDSIFYVAMLLTPSSNTPTIIPLFEKRQLKELLKSDNKSNEFIYISNLYDYKENGSLYELIWSKLERYLEGSETIYFSPSGLLHQISFPAIPTPQQQYLGNQYQLVQLNSTRQLVLSSESPQLASITLFGGIQYAYDTSGLSKEYDKPLLAINEMDGYAQTRDVTKNSASFLAGSVEEIKRITKRLKKTTTMHLITGYDADEASFKALSGSSPKIIHIATHGFFFPNIEKSKEELNKEDGLAFKYDENPLFRSGLHFAGSNYTWKHGYNPYEKEDGILTAYEISNLDLSNTDLVVLSACETGLGDINGSEGVYGLQRAFKMAGVENLIMSLWKVPDKQTVELMELFYANWKKGYDVRSAFKQAQNAMSEKYPPYYWAAFVFVGDVIEPQQPKINAKWWWLASGGLILMVLLVWRKREWQKVA